MSQAVPSTLGTREEKRGFYKRTLLIMLPIALQNLMDAAVSSIDVVMLSFVSQSALAASSLAGQIAFVLFNLLNGLASGAAVMAAQYWGKGDRRTIERVLAIAVRTALIVSLPFTLMALLAPNVMMRIFTNDEALISEGVLYLRSVGISYILGSFVTIYLSVVRSVERVKTSVSIHCSAVVMNIFFNACFIFGIGPFPKLGIFGVGLATTITRVIEVCICLWDATHSSVIRLRIRDLFARGGQILRDFIHFAVPAAAGDIVWGLAFSVYSIILGHLSSDIVAANSVASVVRNLGTSFCYGVACSAAIILGSSMGSGHLKEAREHARRFVRLCILTGLASGALILCLRPFVLDFMHLYVTVTDVVRSEVNIMLFISSYYILGVSLNTMFICGIFRSGGDVKYAFWCDMIGMWCCAVPIGLFCAFVLKLPEMWVYFILCLDEFMKLPVNILHYRKMSWLRNITRVQPDA